MCKSKGNGGMGFKNLKFTNLALLAKQGWRILKNPNSLLAQIFKARYFSQHGFMQASLGSRPSYIWRSILAGREVLELGIRYKVGSGQNIHIWNDPWIPLPYQFRLNHVNRGKWPEATVADLMMPDSNEWNTTLLQYLFMPHEVQAILQIPLSVGETSDHLVWHHSTNGHCSVKSGYIAYQTYQNSFLGCSSVDWYNSQTSIWNKIWKWPVQPKIRHFVWKAMQNILPLGANLAMKGIQEVSCPYCNCVPETDKHVFFECQYARKVWNHLQPSSLWVHTGSESLYSMVSRLVMQESEQLVTLFFVTIWLMWKARCSMCFDRKFMPPSQLISSANVIVNECLSNAVPPHQDIQNYRWIRPQPGSVSVNVDAAVSVDGKTGYGIIIRDSDIHVLAAKAGPLQTNITVEHAELCSLVQGMLLASELKLKNIHIYTDSQLAYNRIDSKEKDWSLVSLLVQRFRMLSSKFQHVSYGFIRRQGNVPAHLLANLGLSICNPINWGSLPPNDVLLAVLFDSVNFNE